jgi:hypothetical protein
MIPGRGNPWWSQRERERAALEREASKLLAADRRRRSAAMARITERKASQPIPEVPSKWVKLSDLKNVLRSKS